MSLSILLLKDMLKQTDTGQCGTASKLDAMYQLLSLFRTVLTREKGCEFVAELPQVHGQSRLDLCRDF